MVRPMSLKLSVDDKSRAAMIDALTALAGFAIEAGHEVAEVLGKMIDGGDDFRRLFRINAERPVAGGAVDSVTIQILPSDVLLDLVAAIARDRKDVAFVVRHGWPVLSVGDDGATVADASGAASGGAEAESTPSDQFPDRRVSEGGVATRRAPEATAEA